jgi:hypothetical protein
MNQGLIHNAQPKSYNTRYSMYESEVHSPIKKLCSGDIYHIWHLFPPGL